MMFVLSPLLSQMALDAGAVAALVLIAYALRYCGRFLVRCVLFARRNG